MGLAEAVEGEVEEGVEEPAAGEVAGWNGVNCMLYPLISRMSRYSLTSGTLGAGMWYAAPQTRSVGSC